MKTLLSLVSGFLLLQTGRCQETNTLAFAINSFPAREVMSPKVSIFPKFSLTLSLRPPVFAKPIYSVRPIVLFTRRPILKEVFSPYAPVELPPLVLVSPEKQSVPSLYCVRLERMVWREEEVDIFGRRWRLSPKTELIFPLFRSDSPSAVGERFFAGAGLSWKF